MTRRELEVYVPLAAILFAAFFWLDDMRGLVENAAATESGVLVKTERYGDHGNKVDLYMPSNESTVRPAVLMIHGGGWSAGSRSEFADWGKGLARQGVVAASIDYRLTSDGHLWPAQGEDVEQAMWWLRENASELGIDPERIAVIGGSAGAHLAGWLATSSKSSPRGVSSRPAAAVSLWGPWDLTQSRVTLSSEANNIVASLVGRDGNRRDASPYYRIDASTAPTLMAHGERDQLVPVKQSVKACETINQQGGACTLLILDGEGHDIKRASNADLLNRKVADFLKQHLGDRKAGA